MSTQCRTVRLIAAIMAATIIVPAHAARVDWLLSLGVQHNDNINFSETDPVSGNIAIPGLGFSLIQEGSTVQANVNGALEYRDYLNGAFADTTRATLNGQVNWTLSPQRLDWTFQDSLTNEPIDQFAADTPANQQQTNAFATGPNLYFGLGKPLHGQFELRYMNSHAETTSQFNSDRYGSAVRLFKDLDTTRQLSGNLQIGKVNFTDSQLAPDYTRYDVYAGYTAQLAQLNLDLAAGYSRLDYQHFNENSSGPLLRASLNWQASQRSSFTGTLISQYTDAAEDLLASPGTSGVPSGGIDTGDISVNSQTYQEKSLEIGYTYIGERLDLNITPYYRKDSYVRAPRLNRNIGGGSASASWRLRPLWTASLSASADNTHYNTQGRDDRTRIYAAGLAWQMTQRLSWRLNASHQSRNSTAPGQTSDQNIVYLSAVFTR